MRLARRPPRPPPRAVPRPRPAAPVPVAVVLEVPVMSEITVPVDEGAFGVFVVVGSDIPVGSYVDSVPENLFL